MNADLLLNSSGGRAVIGDGNVVIYESYKIFGKLLDNRMDSDRSIFDTFRVQFAERIQSVGFCRPVPKSLTALLIFCRPFHDDFKHSLEFKLKGGVKRPKSSFKIIGVWLNIWCTSLDEFWPPVLESRNSLELNSRKYSRLIVANTALHILNKKTPVLYSMDFSSYAHVTPNCDILLHELCERGMPFLEQFSDLEFLLRYYEEYRSHEFLILNSVLRRTTVQAAIWAQRGDVAQSVRLLNQCVEKPEADYRVLKDAFDHALEFYRRKM
ncbi:MAG: hypothetical protein R3C03_07380 [Pirellulaceae bacterium]